MYPKADNLVYRFRYKGWVKGEVDMAGTLEYEELNKNLEMVDGHAVKAPEDYQDPEQL